MPASIEINGVETQEAYVPYGQLVSLGLVDSSPYSRLLWEILPPKRPSDSATIDAAANWPGWTLNGDGSLSRIQSGTGPFADVTGTPDLFHSYTIRCTPRIGITDQTPVTAIFRVRDPRTGEALPAAGENVEADALRGWWTRRAQVDEALARSGGHVRIHNATGGALPAFAVCKLHTPVDVRTIGGNAIPGGTTTVVQKIYTVTLANPADKDAARAEYCVLPAALANGAQGWGVVTGGEISGNLVPLSLQAGSSVFCNLAGQMAPTPEGKTCIQLGTCLDATATGKVAVSIVVHKDGAKTEPMWFRAAEDGTANDIVALQSAIAYAKTYRKNKAVRISANMAITTGPHTLDSGVTLCFEDGGMLSGAGLATLTINSKFAAGPYQIFSGPCLAYGAEATHADPRWWGCVTDGTGDNAGAIEAARAFAANGGTLSSPQTPKCPLRLPSGTIRLTSMWDLSNNANLVVRGDGPGVCELLYDGGVTSDPVVLVKEFYRCKVGGFKINCNAKARYGMRVIDDTGAVAGVTIYNKFSGITIENCKDAAGYALFVGTDGDGYQVSENKFEDIEFINCWNGLAIDGNQTINNQFYNLRNDYQDADVVPAGSAFVHCIQGTGNLIQGFESLSEKHEIFKIGPSVNNHAIWIRDGYVEARKHVLHFTDGGAAYYVTRVKFENVRVHWGLTGDPTYKIIRCDHGPQVILDDVVIKGNTAGAGGVIDFDALYAGAVGAIAQVTMRDVVTLNKESITWKFVTAAVSEINHERYVRRVSTAGAGYTCDFYTRDVLLIPSPAVSQTVTMPPTTTTAEFYDGREILIHDMVGAASPSTPITVNGNGNNIDGASSIVIDVPFASLRLRWFYAYGWKTVS